MTYNVKHGAGMDSQLDLSRSAQVLADLKADFIALQEVDLAAKRSGFSNQVNALAGQLDMHPAFGAFMPYQSGQYGMAILSQAPHHRCSGSSPPQGQ